MNDLLAADHSEIDVLLDDVFAALEAGEAGQIYQKLDFFWARLAMHIRAEHLHLFPAIMGAIEMLKHTAENRPLPVLQTAQSAINGLREDHSFFMHACSAAIKKMRGLSEGNQADEDVSNHISTVREVMITVRRRLEAHNETEESEVYGLVEMLLNQTEQKVLNGRIQNELANLPPRFGEKDKY